MYKLFSESLKSVYSSGKDFIEGKDYNYENPKPVPAPMSAPSSIEKGKEVLQIKPHQHRHRNQQILIVL